MRSNSFAAIAASFHLFNSLCAASAVTFSLLGQFPQPAPSSFVVVGSNLPDGRFVLWNGDEVFVQDFANSAALQVVASGYEGDPGFLLVAPDGHTAYLGAGFRTELYTLDLNAPVDFVSGTELTVPEHYAGEFLSPDLLVLDRFKNDFSAAELVVVDVSAKKSAPIVRSVLTLPGPPTKQQVLEKPAGSFSALLTADPTGTLLYVMDANTRELRTFAIADLINAFNTSTSLDWTADGTAFGAPGDYFSGGVSGFRPNGDLVIGGSEGFAQPGGIQIVDATLETVIETLDPQGDQSFYSVIYNPVTDAIIATTGLSVTYATEGAFSAVPVPTPAAAPWVLGCAALALCAVALVRVARA